MLKNYLITIFRQIQKNKVFSFINILGLALGMAACLVISQYVNFHTSFDTFHSNADQIFRLESDAYKNGEHLGQSYNAPSMMGAALRDQSPEVKEVARFYNYNYANNSIIYTDGDDKVSFEQPGVFIADKGTFELFDFKFLAGSPAKFDEPQKAVLTLTASKKYFDNPEKAIGKSFTLSGNNGNNEYELIGVVDDIPENSHIQFELLLSYPSMDNYTKSRLSWTNSNFTTYMLLSDRNRQGEVMSIINQLHEENSKESYAANGYAVDYFLRPLTDIHLNAEYEWADSAGVDNKTVFVLSFIAMIILVIAWINYMNLSLVRTMERMKEMGIRKCMGSSMKQITQLFILEAFVMNLLAFVLAIFVTQIGEKYLIEVTGLPVSALMDLKVLTLLLGLIGVGTLLIGFYPYILLKTMNVVNILVGNRGKVGGVKMRKSMVFVQFMITFILIAGTVTVYHQINYMRDADLGIDIENILVIKSPPGAIQDNERQDVKRFNTLKTELLKYTGVKEITNGGEIPGEPVGWGASLRLKNESTESSVYTGLISMDVDYPQFFDIDVVAGRTLREGDDPWSKGDVVINAKLAEQLGFSNPEDAVGAEIDGFYGPTLKVRGVVENHHHTSLHDDFMPLAYILSSWTEFYFVKLQLDENGNSTRNAQLSDLVATVKSEWNEVFTDYQMDYFFLDRAFDEQYKEDIRFGKIFSGFSALAILIACLGLFGLTSFSIQQRTKEIGIRKVLGASAKNLMILLSKEYMMLVSAACVVSLPVAWWMMSKWLEDYTFRIDLGWWFVIVPIAFVIGLALLSISSKVLSTIKTNPVKSLRTE
ncbi:ABC transporter permease [Ekhidna sp.]|jgi:putative ABC transport system permease protein|uniref:ABC transporter permease n=1 Tax=Ekhidna sp. TaxID=2608089 RepID=UPI0032EF0B39